MDDLQNEDAKNKRTMAEFEADMKKMDSHVCDNCGAILSERLVREIRTRHVSEERAAKLREYGKLGGRPRKEAKPSQ